jgi:formylglycine-generating enzyme required for sulfatase activity
MVWIPGGEFLMGNSSVKSQKNEQPAHRVYIDGFWIDQFHVTNNDFSKFVRETGYVTTAERKPSWESLSVQLPAGTPPSIRFSACSWSTRLCRHRKAGFFGRLLKVVALCAGCKLAPSKRTGLQY